METTEYRGYRIKATSREGEPRVWQARWTAVRLSGSGAHSKSGSVRGTFTGEREADEAALGEARAWVDQNGRQEWLRRGRGGKRWTGGGGFFFMLGKGLAPRGPPAGTPIFHPSQSSPPPADNRGRGAPPTPPPPRARR